MLSLPTVADLNRLLAGSPFTARYRFQVLSAGAGACELTVPYLPENDRPGGIVSGQVYMHAADVAFWLAVKTRLGTAGEYVTSTMTSAFLGPARKEDFICAARVHKSGRRLIYGEAECRAGDRLLTRHTLTYLSVADAPERGAAEAS